MMTWQVVTAVSSPREAKVARHRCDGSGDYPASGSPTLPHSLLRGVGATAQRQLVRGQLGTGANDRGPVVLRRQGNSEGFRAIRRYSQQRHRQPDGRPVCCVRDPGEHNSGALALGLGEQ